MVLHLLLLLLVHWAGAGRSHDYRMRPEEVFSGEHFFDLVASPTSRSPRMARRSTLLVLYGPACDVMSDVRSLRGMDAHLLVVTHNHVTARDLVWFQWRPEDDLYARYAAPNTQCLSAYYFRAGSSLDTPTAVWVGAGGNLAEWARRQLRARVTITNGASSTVLFFEEQDRGGGEYSVVQQLLLHPGDSATLPVSVSHVALFLSPSRDACYHAEVITVETGPDIVFTDTDARADAMQVWNAEKEENDRVSHWKYSHQERFMRILKQPLFVFNYTEVGYKKTVIPPALYKELKDFYKTHSQHEEKTREWHYRYKSIESLISSAGEETPALVWLTEELQHRVAATVQPLCEEFCNCTLMQKNIIYGIREYFEGSVLHHHIDRAKTHVIGAILQIDQDLGGQEDWVLEVVRYDGTRRTLTLHPGEMLLYESGKLIHGRPKAFRGKIMANLFAHFVTTDWPYWLDTERLVLHDDIRRLTEDVPRFPSDLTAGRLPPPVRPLPAQAKDEL